MKKQLTVLIVSKDRKSIPSEILGVADRINAKLLVDTDNRKPLGIRKQNLIKKAITEWVLLLDTDEYLSGTLIRNINKAMKRDIKSINGYRIEYLNHAFGRPIYYGGEKYAKLRLFRRSCGAVTAAPLHEETVVLGNISPINGVILHYSYRTIWQTLVKFSKYAWIAAKEKKLEKEKVTVKKLFLYGLHMFWARYIKDQGWRDGWRGYILASCFAYMENLTYWLLLALGSR
jgi:(heptosyl)LPS beta-1,4-glucosyltransferase